MSEENVLIEIKPKFSIPYYIISHFWDILVFAFIIVFIGAQQGMLIPALIVFGIMAAIQVGITLIRKKQSKKFFYKFYQDRLVYRDTYFLNKIKEVSYTEFKEIKYYQGFVQSKFNVGQIYIITNSKNIFKNSIELKLIPNLEENYEKIIEIFNT